MRTRLYQIAAALLCGALATAISPPTEATPGYAPGPALEAVATSVAAALARTPIPASTRPPVAGYASSGVNLGRCASPGDSAGDPCQVGDGHGHATVVIFGNSHATMWVPALETIALAAHWKLYLVLKDACGYDYYIDYHNLWPAHSTCVLWYKSALKEISYLHPNVLILGSYESTTYWYQAEDTITQTLRGLTKRFIIIGDDPRAPIPGPCLEKPGATQGTCLYTESQSDIDAETTNADLARDAGVQYISVAPLFCDAGYCPALINGYLPTKDGAHLTRDYSASLSQALGYLLNLTGTSTRSVTSLPLPTTTTTTTLPSTTTTSIQQ